MSISETNVVDFIGVDPAKKIARLAISDHLAWDDPEEEKEHLWLLQEKINSYLRFIEGGELYQNYPDATGASCEIELVSKYPLSVAGVRFFEQARSIVQAAGFDLLYRVFTPQ
ncbi:DUF6572 domain-containing protein [Paraburkholderia domus]|uniref:Uncharacterized protein n=1 Tax=Paraburkholderia domus TaxID=2793075 RepID=A0A9N8R4Y9_9BURK|nr:DUF6572 domain-containing protein [Paraburkholderia domus]MBK5162750.1 hypothetical protein [Burkholderia sp. R-70211]CAE6958491.1 hypothetical protein R70211_06759 [Paraburkholderia domus]